MNIQAVWSACVCLLLAPVLLADSVTLKSGEKIEGKITSETPQEVTIDVKISASIVDSRTVTRAEIASVQKASAEELAWAEVQGIKLGESSLSQENYDGAIGNLQAFVNRFPKSVHTVPLSQLLAAFAEEKHRVEKGEVKIAGRWLTRDEVMRERYQITAQLLFAQMQEQTRRGDLTGALNTFDNVEKNYPGARVFPDAVNLARQILPSLKSAADRTLQNWKVHKVERAQGTALASEPNRTELRAAQQREEKAADATLETAQKAKLNWSPLQAIGEKSATYLSARAGAEAKRLELLPVAAMRQSLQLTDAGVEQRGRQDTAGAATSFRSATTLWAANELASRHQKELTELAARATPAPVAHLASTPPPLAEATPVVKATPRPAMVLATPRPSAEETSGSGGSRSLLYGGIAVVVLGGALVASKYLKKKPEDTEPPTA